MRSTRKQIGYAFALVGAGCLGAIQAAPPASPRAMVAPSRSALPAGKVIPGLGRSVDPAALAHLSGGTNVSESISINGSVSNTSTANVSTGMNWIGGGAFGNAAGLPMVIQNSGNSVLIQNATVVNVQVQP
ncbi:MAG: hypothetical protein ACREP0_03535 [Rhodanobacteraceae bacterium]